MDLFSILGSVVNPVLRPAKEIGELGNILSYAMGQGKIQDYKPLFLNDDELNDFTKYAGSNPLGYAGQRTAGVASFLAPFATGGTSLAATAGAGALGGFSEADLSKPEDIFGNVLGGAVTGGVLGAAGNKIGSLLSKSPIDDIALKGASEAAEQTGNRVSRGLRNFADDRELNALKRVVGTNAPQKLGGAELEREVLNLAKSRGFKINNAEDLLNFSKSITDEVGGKVTQYADDLTGKGLTVNQDELLNPLQEKLSALSNPDLRNPLETGIENIKQSIANKTTNSGGKLTPKDLLELKREWGQLGKFDPFADTSSKSVAKAYEGVYKNANDVLDNLFQQNQITDFRDINDLLETAIKQKQWAKVASGKLRPTATVNDMAQDVAGFAGLSSGNPLMAGPAFIAGKTIQSPGAERALAKVAKGAANIAEGKFLPNISISPQLKGALSSNLGKGAGMNIGLDVLDNIFSGGNMDNIFMADQDSLKNIAAGSGNSMGGGIDTGSLSNPNSMLEYLFMNGATPKTIESFMKLNETMNPHQGQAKLTENDKKLMNAGAAAERALKLLEGGKVRSGKLGNIANSVESFFGNISPENIDYRSNLATARGLAISALSGANVPESEYQRFANMIPEDTDEPEVAKRKLANFMNTLNNYSNVGTDRNNLSSSYGL